MHRCFTCVLACLLTAAIGNSAAAKPLTEKGLTAMAEAGFEDEEIIAKLNKDGVAFEVNDTALAELEKAGLSKAVLEAVAAAAKAPARAGASAITFDSILSLLTGGVDEETILAKLKKSPSVFTLSAEQEKQLRDAGATDALIAAMKGAREADATIEPISDLAIVLDVSGSMREPTADGPSKMEVAKEVVGDLIEKIPDGLNVTLVIYGQRAGCSAVQTVRPLAELKAADKQELISAITALQPVGNTPIALALRRTAEQFVGRKTYCGVVLITDGLESCKGDPAAEAAKLAENPMLRFGVNVVGFGLKDEENEATAKIAAAGKGKYYSAGDKSELLSAINDVTEKLEQGAKPAPVAANKRGRRAVVIRKPEIDMPAMKEIILAKPGSGYSTLYASTINTEKAYDKELRQPSADTVDIWWIPAEGLPIRIAEKFENPEREVRELRMEDVAGMVRVSSEAEDSEAEVVVARNDAGETTLYAYKVQELKGLNKDLVVPAGTYSLWVKDAGAEMYTLLERDLEVVAGEVIPVER